MAQTKKAAAKKSQAMMYPMEVNAMVILFTILSVIFAFMAARNAGML